MEEKALDNFSQFKSLEAQASAFKKDWYLALKKISKLNTPRYDGKGKEIVKRRPDGFDFIIEAYMRDCLDRYFPGWSWEMGGPPQFLGSEWVFVWGTLSIIDEHIAAFGLPAIRKFSTTNGVRIKFKHGTAHSPENVIDIGNDVASANSKAFKKAINQLTHIGDDIYGKRIDEEGAGTLEDVAKAQIEDGGGMTVFGKWIQDNHWRWGDVFEILHVKSIDEITDLKVAMETIKKAKGIE